ncbi:MAG TPA: TonB-dependent receptor [Fulvivirga sp.]|nr:TonB-dependent receptor [Fulvivirga sp.]
MKRITLILLFISIEMVSVAQQNIIIGKKNDTKSVNTVNGIVKDNNGESLFGVTVYIPSLKKGISTDINGHYILNLKKDTYLIQFSMIGYETLSYKFNVRGDGEFDVRMTESSLQLDELTITSEAPDHNVNSTDIGKQVLDINTIERLPAFVGEVDVLKSITLLPGVSTVGEVSSGFNVRGGGSDQNLILLGGAVLYNPSHLFGFFSAFNSEVISDVTLYKGGIPAKYGGRGSSVLNIKYKNGDMKHWKGSGSIGLISAKVIAEGPIVRNKLSLVVGARTSYSDWLLKSVKDPDVKNSSASFYDLNGRLSYSINNKNKLSYSYYLSNDDFSFSSDNALYWSNQNHVIEWNHSNGELLSYDFSLIQNQYEYSIYDHKSENQYDLDFRVDNTQINFDSDIKLFKENYLNAGFQSTLIDINPGELTSRGKSSINDKKLQHEKALESALFVDLNLKITKSLSVSSGIRYNKYYYLGERTIYGYETYVPKQKETIIDSTYYDNLKPIIEYGGFEPRISLKWSLNNTTSIKAGYNKMYQYIHLISNTSTIAPTDVWKLSDTYIKPEIVQQYSLGLFKNFNNNSIETSAEVYYKNSENVISYKDGAELLVEGDDMVLNENIETELLSGIGKAYGLELFIKKKTGKVTGWLSYTYSKSLIQVEGAYDVETINSGKWFPTNFDKPHDFTAVLVYDFADHWSLSSNFTFSTGRPVTYPVAKIDYEGYTLAYFNERNSLRIPNYHRLDFSITYKSPSRKKIWGGEWVFSIYNVYGRKNAFSVFFDDVEGSPPQPYKLSVMGIPFPSLSYNFKF